MIIPRKLYLRMTDMAEDFYTEPTPKKEQKLISFQDEIGWPFRASIEQIHDWENKRHGCDCQNPEPSSGVALVSMECPIHNDNPYPHPR